MSKVNSNATPKPAKPYPDFPLFPHATRRWAKKIRGKLFYFGPWNDPDGSLQKYQAQKDSLHAGRKPRPDPDALTIKDLGNLFLDHKAGLRDAGELSPRTWDSYKAACDIIVEHFGKTRIVADAGPDDFAELRKKLANKWGAVALGNVMQRIRSVFKFAADNGLIATPVRYGQGFKRPSKKTIRLEKAKQVAKLFTPKEIHQLLDQAGTPMKAIILLGINCAFGNSDCAGMPMSAVDLDAAMIEYPRPKTGIPRRCPLWPETIEAVKEALADRPEAKSPAHEGLVFITKYGDSWGKDIADSPITKELRKMMDREKIGGHRNFYCLRHTFRTVADESRDQPAVDHIMGHESAHMSSHYREKISDERLQAVVDHVRSWLLGKAKAGSADDPAVIPVNAKVS